MLRKLLAVSVFVGSVGSLAACTQAIAPDTAVSRSDLTATQDAAAPRVPGPAPEAFAACKSLSEGAACTVKFGDKSVDGMCRKGPDGQGELACAPANMPPPPARGDRPHGPPAEAFAACKSLSEGAACTVKFGDKSVDGTCRKGPDGQGELACAPANMPPPPPAPDQP